MRKMKRISKILCLTLALVLLLGLAACSNSDAKPSAPTGSGSETPSEDPGAAAGGESYTVGICQLAPHPALDAATQGFKDFLTEKLGDSVTFEEQNAGGEAPNCATIVDGFVASKVDLIMANATPAVTAAASATADIPILGTAVTNYGVALDLDTTEDKVLGGNISGTSDLAPLDQQAQMLHDLFPEAKNVGLLYCSAEANSLFQVEGVQGYLEDMGYTCTQYACTDENDLSAVTQNAVDNADVL